MRDRIVMPAMVVLALAMAALAMVWPQGLGRPSPPPFGHPVAAPEEKVSVGDRTVDAVRGAQHPDDLLSPPK